MHGYAFLGTRIILDSATEVKLLENHVFRKASKSEAEQIHSLIQNYQKVGHHSLPCPYRHMEDEKGAMKRLPADEWMYWIVAFNGTNEKMHELECATSLIPTELEFATTIFFMDENDPESFGHVIPQTHHIERWKNLKWRSDSPQRITKCELESISDVFNKITKLEDQNCFVKYALESFYSSKQISSNISLKVVAYFSIIESLVTHAPRLAESLDSITHQIVRKLILLSKLFTRDLTIRTRFNGASEEKIWKMLYRYRSYIAHGTKADFKSEFQALSSKEHVETFLKEVIKELILIGLSQKEFLADLKEC